MSFFDRFFGRTEVGQSRDALMANIKLEGTNPYSLQVLLGRPLALDEAGLAAALRAFHPELADARAELNSTDPAEFDGAVCLGLAGWGRHVVKLVGVDAPMPPDAAEVCLQPAHFGPEFKRLARAHRSHVMLYYAGFEADPVERYVALAAVAVALGPAGAVVVMNEDARSAFPVEALAPGEGEDGLAALRTLPLPMLYAGFVKLEVADEPGVWMRTFGCHLLGLPDLAVRAAGHHQGQETFELFSGMLDYLRESGNHFADGHTIQAGEGTTLRLRAPRAGEDFLDGPGELFVVEGDV